MHNSSDFTADGCLETICLQCLENPSMEDKNGEQNYFSLRTSTLNSIK